MWCFHNGTQHSTITKIPKMKKSEIFNFYLGFFSLWDYKNNFKNEEIIKMAFVMLRLCAMGGYAKHFFFVILRFMFSMCRFFFFAITISRFCSQLFLFLLISKWTFFFIACIPCFIHTYTKPGTVAPIFLFMFTYTSHIPRLFLHFKCFEQFKMELLKFFLLFSFFRPAIIIIYFFFISCCVLWELGLLFSLPPFLFNVSRL